ncbi:MAG: bile acid:sodium symporter, partial [Myxococcales bacterium]
MRALLGTLRPDAFTLSLLATVALATVLPARGPVAAALSALTTVGIGVLFFLHGARLSRQAIVDGAAHWRLHLAVLASTFVLFPLLGELLGLASPALVRPPIAAGLLFVCLLPSTVQSSIAFTSVAGGNIPAAVCSASLSNVLGVFVTPLLVSLLLAPGSPAAAGASDGRGQAVGRIVLELLVPFVLGHLSRPWTGTWVDAHRAVLSYVDRGSIMLVVYTAFSAAVVEGLWGVLSGRDLATVLLGSSALLAAVLTLTTWGARRLGFARPDEITLVFCGSKKSLASGVPLANVLFPPASVGVVLVPL